MTNIVQTWINYRRECGWTTAEMADHLTTQGTRVVDRGALYQMAKGHRRVPECCANIMMADVLRDQGAAHLFPLLRLPSDDRDMDQRAREAGL